MKQSSTETIFSVKRTNPGDVKLKLRRSSAKELGLNEGWFQQAIAEQPNIVIGPCQAGELTDEEWFTWGREVNVPTVGPIDILLVSASGRIGIVETKLAHSPENRRKILAQILDYAVNLPNVSIDALPDLPEEVDEEDARVGLETGNYLLILSSDCADDRAIRLSDALLGDHMLNPWDLALIDVVPYVSETTPKQDDILLVGSLRRASIAEPRHVVKVEVVNQEYPPVVTLKPIVKGERIIKGRVTIPRNEITERLSQNLGPQIADSVEGLIHQFTHAPYDFPVHITSRKLRLKYRSNVNLRKEIFGNDPNGKLPFKALFLLDIYPSGHLFFPCGSGLIKRGMNPERIEVFFNKLRNIHPLLAPELNEKGSYNNVKDENKTAPIKAFAERLPELIEVIQDFCGDYEKWAEEQK